MAKKTSVPAPKKLKADAWGGAAKPKTAVPAPKPTASAFAAEKQITPAQAKQQAAMGQQTKNSFIPPPQQMSPFMQALSMTSGTNRPMSMSSPNVVRGTIPALQQAGRQAARNPYVQNFLSGNWLAGLPNAMSFGAEPFLSQGYTPYSGAGMTQVPSMSGRKEMQPDFLKNLATRGRWMPIADWGDEAGLFHGEKGLYGLGLDEIYDNELAALESLINGLPLDEGSNAASTLPYYGDNSSSSGGPSWADNPYSWMSKLVTWNANRRG